MSLVPSNLQKIRQDLNAICQWGAHLTLLRQLIQVFATIMETQKMTETRLQHLRLHLHQNNASIEARRLDEGHTHN